MFFASDSIRDSLIMTIADILYGKSGENLIVMLSPRTFKEIGVLITGTYGEYLVPIEVSCAGYVWKIQKSTITFVFAEHIGDGKVFIGEESKMHIITKNTTDGEEKNTLP